MKKWVIGILLFLLVTATIVGAVYSIPRMHSAGILHKNGDMVHFAYEAEVEFKQEALKGTAKYLVNFAAGLLGVESSDLCELTIQGNVYENTIYAQISAKETHEMILELYLSAEERVLNVTAFLNGFKDTLNSLKNSNSVMGAMVPDLDGEIYLSTEQVQALFGIDLSFLDKFSYNLEPLDLNTFECFLELLPLKRESMEEGCAYVFETEHIQAQINIPHEDGAKVRESLYVKEPSEVIQNLEDSLKLFKVQIPTVGTEMMEKFSIEIITGEGEEILIPKKTDAVLLNILVELMKRKEQ